MEDLVEELIGDITDEYDVVAAEEVGVRGDLVIDGLTTLEDFADKSGLVLPEGPYDTLAGFFMARLGQLPSVGDFRLSSPRSVQRRAACSGGASSVSWMAAGPHFRRPPAGRKDFTPDSP